VIYGIEGCGFGLMTRSFFGGGSGFASGTGFGSILGLTIG